MKIRVLSDPCQLRKETRPVVMAAGFFDGMHKGHRKVIETALARSAAINGQTWVLTFDKHPLKVLNPSRAPSLLTPTEQKLRLLDEMKITGCILLPFTRRLSKMTARSFAGYLTGCIPSLREFVVGDNWRFGHGRTGRAETLSVVRSKTKLRTTVVRPVVRDGSPVSSTRIRACILDGNIEEANVMLGRPFSILGRVIHGRSKAGCMGFPTANLETATEVLPPFGVYAVVAFVMDGMKNGVLNYGTRPTLMRGGKSSPVIEVHLFDFHGNLYGREMEIFFVERIRDEKEFQDEEALQKQVNMDIRMARAILGSRGPKKNN
jgi:riboflavin kinase / FMN adenylyltransferase